MAGTPYTGKEGRVQVNAVNINLERWEVNDTVEEVDGTNFESNGYSEGTFGIQRAEVKFSGFWDADDNPMDDPPKLQPGTELTNGRLYHNVTDNLYWDFPKLRCYSVRVTTEVKGRVDYEVTCVSQGTYTRPGQ